MAQFYNAEWNFKFFFYFLKTDACQSFERNEGGVSAHLQQRKLVRRRHGFRHIRIFVRVSML